MKSLTIAVAMLGVGSLLGWYADRLYVAHVMRQISDDPTKVNQFTVCLGQTYRDNYPYAPGDKNTGASPDAWTPAAEGRTP